MWRRGQQIPPVRAVYLPPAQLRKLFSVIRRFGQARAHRASARAGWLRRHVADDRDAAQPQFPFHHKIPPIWMKKNNRFEKRSFNKIGAPRICYKDSCLNFTYGVGTPHLVVIAFDPNLSDYKMTVLNLLRVTENDNMNTAII